MKFYTLYNCAKFCIVALVDTRLNILVNEIRVNPQDISICFVGGSRMGVGVQRPFRNCINWRNIVQISFKLLCTYFKYDIFQIRFLFQYHIYKQCVTHKNVHNACVGYSDETKTLEIWKCISLSAIMTVVIHRQRNSLFCTHTPEILFPDDQCLSKFKWY